MAWLLERKVERKLPEEWGGIVPTDVFVEEAKRIVDLADKRGLTLRIMGGLGILIHSMDNLDLAKGLKRSGMGEQEYTDIDLMSYRSQRKKVTEFFGEINYVKRKATLSSAASERQIYYHPQGWFTVDVFYDELIVANHPINFKGRLELDKPTITVTDLLLEKIQIWEAFSEKDLKDCILLLASHDISFGFEPDKIDAKYIAQLLSRDWGFYYTATTNLKKLLKFITEFKELAPQAKINPNVLNKEKIDEIKGRIEGLLKAIEEEPKSTKWKMRAKIGTKKRWYNPVERPETVSGFGIWEALK